MDSVNELVISPCYCVRLASHTTRRCSFPNGVFRIVRSDRRMRLPGLAYLTGRLKNARTKFNLNRNALCRVNDQAYFYFINGFAAQ